MFSGVCAQTPLSTKWKVFEMVSTNPLIFLGFNLEPFETYVNLSVYLLGATFSFDNEKWAAECKTWDLRPKKSDGCPACGGSLQILAWTSTIKPFFEFPIHSPHEYQKD